jgi:nucleoside-diphosphate-sugar epimerase
MPANKVLVAGASGVVGHAAIAHFAARPDWAVVGVSRRVPDDLPGAELLSVDLTDADACARVFGALGDVTHLVYAALQEQPGLMPGWVDPELIERNGAMLRNLFEPLSAAAGDGLQHVSLLHGTKAYGIHHPSVGLAGVHIPLREREPRREHPNFYFVQEDYLRAKQQGARWGLTVFRPTVIYGDAPGNNMNPIPAIAAYAALLREEGRPLDFPGQGDAPTLREAVDADLVAEALGWAATSPAAADGTYNLTNGDVFMWEHVWPAIAEHGARRAPAHVAGGGAPQT